MAQIRNPSWEKAAVKACSVMWILIATIFFMPILSHLAGLVWVQTDYYGWALLVMLPILLLGIGIQMFRMRRSAIGWIQALVAVCAIYALWLLPDANESQISISYGPFQWLVVIAVVTALVVSIWNLFRLREQGLLS